MSILLDDLVGKEPAVTDLVSIVTADAAELSGWNNWSNWNNSAPAPKP
ncbi:hypothetical protein ACFXDE_01880 [Kitasatospora sp. NPDC059408]